MPHDDRDPVTPAAGSGVLVVCVGNDLAADDGAGCAVYQNLAAAPPVPGVRLHALATGGLSLVDELRGGERLIVVDAVQFGAPPGTVHVREWDRLPAGGGAVSLHGIGVREAVDVTVSLYPERAPRQVFFVGIEGACFDRLGQPLSRDVAAGVEDATRLVAQLMKGGGQ
jgi:hydrogenase maturation protease